MIDPREMDDLICFNTKNDKQAQQELVHVSRVLLNPFLGWVKPSNFCGISIILTNMFFWQLVYPTLMDKPERDWWIDMLGEVGCTILPYDLII